MDRKWFNEKYFIFACWFFWKYNQILNLIYDFLFLCVVVFVWRMSFLCDFIRNCGNLFFCWFTGWTNKLILTFERLISADFFSYVEDIPKLNLHFDSEPQNNYNYCWIVNISFFNKFSMEEKLSLQISNKNSGWTEQKTRVNSTNDLWSRK